MASEPDFAEYVFAQIGLGPEITYRKMFGEYAVYLNGTVVAFVCDNQLYVKPTAQGRALLGRAAEHSPFPGAKPYFRIDDELDQRELIQRLLRATALAAPLPKPKAAKTSPPATAARRRTTINPKS
ncbi:MAG: TfoX/Sxy family protein [Caldimonas sp.]